jgi:ABC-type transport system involved in cytochrome c biogenesis permease subunit
MAMVSYLIGGVAFTASTRFRIPFLDVSFMVLTAAVLETLLHRIVPGTQATTPHETASPNR